MILVERVRCKNFLSYGNAWTEFSLASHKATLIRGKNGHGKSAILDLLMFALYGKPYRNINKHQLTNSINQSGLLVEIYFTIGQDRYLVVRGLKPAIFDIFKNDELLEQEAATRDYQGYLESNILQVSERTFKQTAVLGSASYVPFMKLATAQRRELVESILDIGIFSQMNIVLRDRMTHTKTEIAKIQGDLKVKRAEAAAQQRLITVIQDNKSSRVDEHEVTRANLFASLATSQTELDALQQQRDSNKRPVKLEGREELDEEIRLLTATMSRLDDARRELNGMSMCPTCFGEITTDHVHAVDATVEKQLGECSDKLKWLRAKESKYIENNALWVEWYRVRDKFDSNMSNKKREVGDIAHKLAQVDASIDAIKDDVWDVLVEQNKLGVIAAEAKKLFSRKNELTEDQHLQDVAYHLLKDTGIKTAVVKEYLPILNQLINKYLAMFDFFVDFTLDDSFEEVIRSRGRDVYTYSSFSEGEKRRIDFAILMAFRQLAATKNSVKTNILILDEIVDGSFDLEARDAFSALLDQIPDSNIIVISHANASTEQYDRVIHVEKKGDFSTYEVSN